MQNNKILWIVAAVAAACGIALLIVSPSTGSRNPSNASTTPATVSQTPVKAHTPTRKTQSTAVQSAPTQTVKVAGVGPLSSMLAFKEPLVCTVKTMSAYTKRSGNVYISSGELRGNFTSYIDGTLTKTSMIDDGAQLYTWHDGATAGLALPAATSASGSAMAGAGGVDPAAQVSYSCSVWTADTSVFTPPSTVTFSNTL